MSNSYLNSFVSNVVAPAFRWFDKEKSEGSGSCCIPRIIGQGDIGASADGLDDGPHLSSLHRGSAQTQRQLLAKVCHQMLVLQENGANASCRGIDLNLKWLVKAGKLKNRSAGEELFQCLERLDHCWCPNKGFLEEKLCQMCYDNGVIVSKTPIIANEA